MRINLIDAIKRERLGNFVTEDPALLPLVAPYQGLLAGPDHRQTQPAKGVVQNYKIALKLDTPISEPNLRFLSAGTKGYGKVYNNNAGLHHSKEKEVTIRLDGIQRYKK